MKRKKILTVILSLMISALMLAFSVITVVAYSSDEDPLVTLSYLNEVVIPKLKAELGASSQNGNNGSGSVQTGTSSNTGDASGTYETLYDGDEFAINAYCIIPRGNDGRGIRVFSEKAYILIRGEYEIG